MNVVTQSIGEHYALYCGDSCEVLKGLPDHSVHLSIYSPPFSSLYVYSPTDRDMGNVRSEAQFFENMAYLTAEMKRVMMPGRIVCMHVYDIQQYENTHGIRERYDFPGDCIRHMQEHGFAYKCRITIDKNPQAAAIRNHPVELLFGTMRRDRADIAPSQADYILVFQAPGDNPERVVELDDAGRWRADEIDEETWIRWARPVWTDIRETEVLDDIGSKESDDERHLCPLQLPTIERCIKLWSNKGEIVLDPFSGIGSTVHQAITHGRYGLGIDLKESYHNVAVKNCQHAELMSRSGNLYDLMMAPAEPVSLCVNCGAAQPDHAILCGNCTIPSVEVPA